jgi:hypothetical protein
MLSGFAHHARGAEQRLHRELGGRLAREADADPRLDQHLGEEENVCGPGPRKPGHRVEMLLGKMHHARDFGEDLVRVREMLRARVRSGRDRCGAFTDKRGRVRHDADDGNAIAEASLQRGDGDPSGDGHHQMAIGNRGRHRLQHDVDVLRLDGRR